MVYVHVTTYTGIQDTMAGMFYSSLKGSRESAANKKSRLPVSPVGDVEMAVCAFDSNNTDSDIINSSSLILNIDNEAASAENRTGFEEPKLSKEDPQETRHLKDLLLLHLDLIQQQQEIILGKDRQIHNLKQEKNAVSSIYFELNFAKKMVV